MTLFAARNYPLYSCSAGRRGLSLAEVLVSIVFLVFGLGATLGLYGKQTNNLIVATHARHAELLAGNSLARAQAAGYTTLLQRFDEAATVVEPPAELFPTKKRKSGKEPDFWRTMRLEKIQIEGLDCIRVTVRAGWDEPPKNFSDEKADHIFMREVTTYVSAD